MVSKVDESSHPWGLLKILCDTDIPITAASDSPLLSQSMKPVSIDGIINIAMEQIGDKNNFEEKVDLKITKEYEPKVFRPLNLPEKGQMLDAK